MRREAARSRRLSQHEAERLGYLQREPDPTDGRAKLIRFTDKGWAAVDTALTALHQMEADLVARLGGPAVLRLRKTLLNLLGPPS